MCRLRLPFVLLLSLLLTAPMLQAQVPPAVPGADREVQRGQRLYLRCIACHEIGAQRATRIGPPLTGVVGRKAGAVPGYAYSKALAAADFAWDEGRLHAWLLQPTALVSGTTMVFDGIASEADRAALIAYLRAVR